jgi:threonine/homoserine/homoserine lactone efflux protein
MWSYFALGLSMGLSAGISPGPLLTLVVTATLRSGFLGGLLVALAPLVTDIPIIVLSVLLVERLPPEALRWVGTAGGLVVIWLGVEILRSAGHAVLPTESGTRTDPWRELRRGVVVNALNPHPYLFWATVGAPTLVSGWQVSPWFALAFLVPFYALLVGSKMAVAWLVSRQTERLSMTWYRRALAACGLLMLMLGVLLIRQAWTG